MSGSPFLYNVEAQNGFYPGYPLIIRGIYYCCRLVEEHLVGEAIEPVKNYDLLSVIVVCPGGPDGENYNGIPRMLDVLLGRETSEAEKRKILQDGYDIPMTQTMEQEVPVMCNLSKGVMEKGRAEGMAENTLMSIKNLVDTLGLTIEQAMAALKVPENEQEKYRSLIRESGE